MEVDVVMCGYNEAPHVPRALASLRSQSVDARSFRVIFVDNASRDETRRVVEENSHGLNLEYVYEPQAGLNFARNAGYRHATAAYVAHIDADAKADPRWIETILKVIREERPDLCGGPYYPYYIDEKPAWFLDGYNATEKGDVPRYLGEHEFLNGTNMIWRRSVVEQLGGFNVDIGLALRGFARGDETNLIVRARKEIAGFKAFYHPGIIVYHLTRPEWFSMWYWVRRNFTQGIDNNKIFQISAPRRSRLLRLAQFAGAASLVGAKGLRVMIQRDRAAYPYWENYWYERMMPEIHRLGEIWGLVRQHGQADNGDHRTPD